MHILQLAHHDTVVVGLPAAAAAAGLARPGRRPVRVSRARFRPRRRHGGVPGVREGERQRGGGGATVRRGVPPHRFDGLI